MAWDPDQQRRDEEGDASEDEVDEIDYKTQKDAVLFAIDVSSSMMRVPPPSREDRKADTDSAVTAALKCASQVMQQRIICQPKDMMGVLLFGTEKSKFRDSTTGGSATSYPHCYLFTDLDVPSAQDVKALKTLAEEGQDDDDVLVPSAEPVSMANLIFCANYVFTTQAANFGSRRLFIITDNDDPHGGSKDAKASAAVRAKDLYDLGVIIELFPISHGDKKFDLTKFYDDIIYRDPVEEDVEKAEGPKMAKSGDGLTLLKSLISNINSKQTPKRAYFSKVPFEIAPGLIISIKGYAPLHRQEPARSCYVYLEGDTPLLAQGETTRVDSSTRTVEKAEIRKAYKFGGEHVHFSSEDLKKLRDFGPPCLRIIGFKPRKLLPVWASVKKSIFIYPSEAEFVGSTRVFSALWRTLLRSKKMGLAWFVARKNANPMLVAILPSRGSGSGPDDGDDIEAASAETLPYLPAGLWLHPLPFADDVRTLSAPPETDRAPDALVDAMQKIVQNLQLPKGLYNPERHPNPALQWHYKILQAKALEEDVPEQAEDQTVPKYRQIDKRVGGSLADLKDDIAVAAGSLRDMRAIKKEADDEDDGGIERPAKRSKTAAAASTGLAASLSVVQLKKAVEDDTLKKMTMADLKNILANKGLAITGKKSDLLERLEQWLEDN